MDGGASKQGSGPMSLDSLTSGKWITPPSSGLPHHQSGGAAQVGGAALPACVGAAVH